MKLTIYLLLGMFMLMVIPSAVALPPFQENTGTIDGLQIYEPKFSATKYNTTFNLKIHVSNISNGVQLPNSNVDCRIHLYDKIGGHLFEGGVMTKDINGFDHEQTLTYGNFTQYGEYNAYYIWCNMTGLGGAVRGVYEVTANGKPSPEGIIIISFIIIMLFILSYSVVMIVKAMGHIIDKDFDLMDIAIMWGMYFGLLGLNQLAQIYLGNVDINNWLDLFVKVYAFPMVLLPVFAFFLSLFNMNKRKKEAKMKW